MKPKTFAAFFQYGVNSKEPIEACGDRSVIILDGRYALQANAEIARAECLKRGYIGFTINHGTFTSNRVLRPLEFVAHTFNTERWYSEKGQRIAWMVLSTGNVFMVDFDRMIDYVLIIRPIPNLAISNADVLAAYDQNRTAPWNEAEYEETRRRYKQLSDAAKAVGGKARDFAAL